MDTDVAGWQRCAVELPVLAVIETPWRPRRGETARIVATGDSLCVGRQKGGFEERGDCLRPPPRGPEPSQEPPALVSHASYAYALYARLNDRLRSGRACKDNCTQRVG